MKKYTLKDIRKAERRLKKCPFCGKRPRIIFTDDEGNPKDQDSEEYLSDPWSGLCFWISHPEKECVIGTDWRECDHYMWGYDTPEQAVRDWNRRNDEETAKPAKKQKADQEGRS